tara:strand:- start:2293 stop:7242 length:4950 start_codon:yes stop_codon:yes gene_type:complete
MKEKLPGLQAALKRMLQDIADSVTMVFNGDTGYFVPALIEDNKLFDLDQAIESLPNILTALQEAESSGNSGNGSSDGIASIPTFALQCLKATIPLGVETNESGEESVAPNQLDNLDAENQTKLAEEISKNQGESESQRLGEDVFGKNVNIVPGEDNVPDPDKIKSELFKTFMSTAPDAEGVVNANILKDLSSDKFVAKSLRKALRSRFEVKVNLQESSVTLQVPRKRNNKVVYKTLAVDALIDSFHIDITETGERLLFSNSRYINESVQIYAKINGMLATETDPGLFIGEYAPQLIIFDKIISDSLELTEDEVDKEVMNILYQNIRKDLIFKMRKQISISKFFKKAELENLDLTPASRDAKDECGIPIRVYSGDVKVASLLNPDKFIDEAMVSYAEAAAKECETGPAETPPLQQAVSEMALKMYIRTFVVNSSLNTLFMMAKFKVEDYFDDKVFLDYLMKFIKDDMLERRLYTDGKNIAKSIIFKRSERGDEILPKLTTGYDCIKFLTQEQFTDVSDQFRMILATSIKNDDLYDYNKDKFLSLAVLDQPKHVFPYNLAVENTNFTTGEIEKVPVPFGAGVGTALSSYDSIPLMQIIENETDKLGFETITETRNFYHQKNRQITFTDVLGKESFFILEPYIKVKEEVYENIDALMERLAEFDIVDEEAQAVLDNYNKQLGSDNPNLNRPVNLLIAPFINASFAAGINSDQSTPDVIYDSVDFEDLYNWNTGLVNYVNMKEYSKFLKSLYDKQQQVETTLNQILNSIESTIEDYDQAIEDAQNFENETAEGTSNLSNLNKEIFSSMHYESDWPSDITEKFYGELIINAGVPMMTFDPFADAYAAVFGLDVFEAQEKWQQMLEYIRVIQDHFFYNFNDDNITKDRFAEYYPISADASSMTPDQYSQFVDELTIPTVSADQGLLGWPGNNFYPSHPNVYDYVVYEGTKWLPKTAEPLTKAPYNIVDTTLFYQPSVHYPRLYSMLDQILNYYPVFQYDVLQGFGTPNPLAGTSVRHTWLQQWILVAAEHSILSTEELEELGLSEQKLSKWPDVSTWGLTQLPNPADTNLYSNVINPAIIAGIGYNADDAEVYQPFTTFNSMPNRHKQIITTDDVPSNILTFGTTNAISAVYSLIQMLREYKAVVSAVDPITSSIAGSEEASAATEFFENKYAEISKNTLPSKMKDIINHPIEDLLASGAGAGYIDDLKWGLRLSYVSEKDNLPLEIVEKIEEEYENSNLEYFNLPSTPGLTNLDGAPQHKAEVSYTYGENIGELAPILAKKYYTIPIVERELSFKEKFLSDQGDELAITDLSIKDIFATYESSMEPDDLPFIEDFYFKRVHQRLVDEIKFSDEYNSFFDYALPLRRYVTLNSINIMMTMTKIGPGPLMYISTRDILQSIISSALRGSGPDGFEYDDPQLAALGGNAGMFSDAMNSKNFEPKKMNLGAMILKLFLQTPFKILKGITEAFDPNISIIDKILKVLKIIIETLPTKADPCIVEPVFLAYIGDYLNESGLPEGTALPSSKLQELKDKAQTDMDRKLRKIKNTLKDVLNNMPVPLISIAMLPSMLPYGCGFPPPPIGPGIGPPLTPFGVAYLVFGLYRDIDFGGFSDIAERSNDDELPDDIEILCKEKHEAYQRLVAQGQLDMAPMDDDD